MRFISQTALFAIVDAHRNGGEEIAVLLTNFGVDVHDRVAVITTSIHLDMGVRADLWFGLHAVGDSEFGVNIVGERQIWSEPTRWACHGDAWVCTVRVARD